jgi:hypothetical protein
MPGGLSWAVYNPTNTTKTGDLSLVLNGSFVDEFNSPGAGTVSVPLDTADAALLVKDAVVRVTYEGAVRYAWVVETLDISLVSDDGQRVLTAAGRGLLCWLADMVTYPQGGYLADFATADRPFNFASAAGQWESTATWTTPQAVTWKSDATARAGLPVGWKDPDAKWIWRTNPSTAVQRGTVNFFRRSFTLTESKLIRFFATADNYFELYLDGARVMDSSRFTENAPSFAQMTAYTVRLSKGTHTLAARVRNDKPWQRSDLSVSESDDKVRATDHGLDDGTALIVTEVKNKRGESGGGLTEGSTYYVKSATADDFKLSATAGGTAIDITKDLTIAVQLKADSTAGFILAAFEVNASGKLTTNQIVQSGTAGWTVTETEPKWFPALILRTLVAEAEARGVYRASTISFGYTWASPTSGTWTTKVDLTMKVGTDLLTVMDQMVDLGHDFWMHPTTSTLYAWETRGTDLSATVDLAIADNLLAYSTKAEPKLKTLALIRTRDGWTTNSYFPADFGRREVFMEFGNTRSDEVAKAAAQKVLRRTGKAKRTAQTEAVPVTGSTPYVDFTVGDVISVPSPDGSTTAKARVLSIGLENDGNNVRFSPEVELL